MAPTGIRLTRKKYSGLALAMASYGASAFGACLDGREAGSAGFVATSLTFGSAGPGVKPGGTSEIVGLEAGRTSAPVGKICPSYSLQLLSGEAHLTDPDHLTSATLSLPLGAVVRVGGHVEVSNTVDGLLVLGLGAAHIDYAVQGLESGSTSGWSGRIGELDAGLAWHPSKELELQVGVNLIHVVTGTGKRHGVDAAADPTASSSDRAVNLNMTGPYASYGIHF